MYITMIKYTLRLNEKQLEQLKSLSTADCNVSQHIRKAINKYLSENVPGFNPATSPSKK